jgi:hypothetical protein
MGSGVASAELGGPALAGFVAAARRLSSLVTDEGEFHRQCCEERWRWGRAQGGKAKGRKAA